MLHEYYLFNCAPIATLQGQTLTFHATTDLDAIFLGAKYAQKLGWERYSIVKFDGEKEITITENR
jgi:hypothetical protein